MSKGILVFVEQRAGVVQQVGLELLGQGRRLAEELQEEVLAVLLGKGLGTELDYLYEYGADRIVLAEDPLLDIYTTETYTKTLVQIIQSYAPSIVLFGATAIGRDLAPRVAARLHTGLTADCTSLSIDPESKLLLMTRPAFGGNLMATIVCQDYRPQMATVRPGVMKISKEETAKRGGYERIDLTLKASDVNVEVLEILPRRKRNVDISKAKVLVSVGRGIGKDGHIEVAKDLADLLGGELSASRGCVDSGWMESERQVGQTGKTVRPELYLAFGISGAVQHTVGMEESNFIIAINKDENAPIMNLADVAIVGDLHLLLPKLVSAIQARKTKEQAS